jgi:hypothetical protein
MSGVRCAQSCENILGSVIGYASYLLLFANTFTSPTFQAQENLNRLSYKRLYILLLK